MNLAAAHLLAIICRDDTAKEPGAYLCVLMPRRHCQQSTSSAYLCVLNSALTHRCQRWEEVDLYTQELLVFIQTVLRQVHQMLAQSSSSAVWQPLKIPVYRDMSIDMSAINMVCRMKSKTCI
jgi:hypothetical protein